MSEASYRLLAVALCITTSVAAPQTQDNSNITYVKPQHEIPAIPTTYNSSRQSSIENIPLTIPNIDKNTNQSEDKSDGNGDSNYPDKINSDFDPTFHKGNTTNQTEVKSNENINSDYSHHINSDIETKLDEDQTLSIITYLPDTIPNQSNNTEIIADEIMFTQTISDSVSDDNQTDNLASESRQFDSRFDDSTASYEEDVTAVDVTEEVTVNTVLDEETTRAPSPKLLSKLSYFGKSTFGSHSYNLISRTGKRGFISKCKCERIWNCTKLQITVPRCPTDYFLCC